MYKIVGTCSLCKGFVTLPTVWHSVSPAVPTCQDCGATKKDDLPVVEMEHPGKTGSQLLNEFSTNPRTWYL